MTSRDERGAISAFVVVFASALILIAGLVVDGGYVLAARRNAINEAESAARAGAQAVVPSGPNNGEMRLVPDRAVALAQDQLDRLGHQGTVVVDGDVVEVDVTYERQMSILGLAGLGAVTIRGHGEANGVSGINQQGDF